MVEALRVETFKAELEGLGFYGAIKVFFLGASFMAQYFRVENFMMG